MQVHAFITANGSKPQRSMLSYTFERAKVSDLCAFVGTKMFCPPGSTFHVSLKATETPDTPVYYAVAQDVDLVDKAEMFITIDPPPADTNAFQLPRASPPPSMSSQSQPDTPRLSQASTSDQTPASSQRLMPSTPAATATAVISDCSGDTYFMEQMTALLSSQGTSPAPPSSSTSRPLHTPILNAFYLNSRKAVEDSYVAMKPEVPVVVNDINVHDFFGLPVRKAALVILKDPLFHEPHLLAAARYISKKAFVELLVKAYPEYSCPKNACEPVMEYLVNSTGNEWFRSLRTTDGTSLIMNAFKKRQRRFRDTQSPRDPRTPTKKAKIAVEAPAPEDLEAVVIALAASSSAKEIRKIVSETAELRYTWIKSMEAADDPQIPETFMKKFPCFISDSSLLHEDFKFNMLKRRLPVADFSAAFKTLIPAIYALAAAKNVLPPDTTRPADPGEEACLACKLLINLVPEYCKRNSSCKPDRLFAEAWDSTFINALHQLRRDLKQTAPMIFVISNFPSRKQTYLVATDDFALKVRGTFIDALQSLMELHYVFDLAYAKELKPFFLLIEKIADLELKRPYSTLMDLYFDLRRQAYLLIDEENLAPSNPDSSASNNPLENDPSETNGAPQEEEIVALD